MANCAYCDAIAWSGERCSAHWDKGKPATTEPTQLAINRIRSATAAHSEARKEAWIKCYIFFHGKQWSDPRPTREEAERAWADAHPVHTTEPPEWKGQSAIVTGLEVTIYDRATGTLREIPAEEFYAPLFAKPEPTPVCATLCHRPECNRNGCRHTPYSEVSPFAKDVPEITRAMSTPLDPDIHTRLMPWKGRADE